MANNLPWFLSRFGPTTKYLLYVLIQQPFPRLQIHPPSSSSSLICPSSTSSRRTAEEEPAELLHNKLTPTMCLLLFLMCPEFGIASKQADWMRDVVIRRIPVSDIFADYLSFPIRSDTVSLKVHIPEKHFPKQRYTAREYNIRGGHQRPRRRRRRYYYYDNVNKIKERALFLSIVCGLPRSCLCNDGGHKINV